MMRQKAYVILGIFLNVLLFTNCSRRHTTYRHLYEYNGLKCPAALFEYKVTSEIVCTLTCVGGGNCVGVFYSESSTLCTGCGEIDVGDLVESTEDTKYLNSCTDTDPWSYFEGSYYKLISTYTEYEQAKRNCRQFCGWLVHFDNTQEAEFVNGMAATAGVSDYAIGLEYNTNDSTWRWIDDNTEPTFTDWNPSEPNGVSEYCVVAYGQVGFRWVDLTCQTLPYVCEK